MSAGHLELSSNVAATEVGSYRWSQSIRRPMIGAWLAVGIAAMAFASEQAHAAVDAYSTAVNANSPYAYYRCGESSGTVLTDSSGSGRNGTYTNSPTLGQAGYASGGSTGDTAVDFNGTNNYGSLGGATSFGSALSQFSIEMVFKTTTTANTTILGTANKNNSVSLQIGLNTNSAGSQAANQTRFFLRCSEASNYYFTAAFTNSSLYDGNYHDVVFSFTQSTATLNVYVDGNAQTVTKANGNVGLGTFSDFEYSPLVGANNNRGTANAFSAATVDELALYNTALSSADVQAHYAALAPVPEPAALGLLGISAGAMILRRRKL